MSNLSGYDFLFLVYNKNVNSEITSMLFSEKTFRFLKTIIKWIGVVVALFDIIYLLLSRKKKFKELFQRSNSVIENNYINK